MATLYNNRDWVAALPSLCLVSVLVFGGLREVRTIKPKYDEPVQLEMISVAAVPPPPEPVKPPPEPQPRMQPQSQPQVQPVVPVQASVPSTHSDAPHAAPVPVSVPVTPAPPVAKVSEAPPQTTAPKPNLEAEFIARIRTYLNSVKRYPTGREASQLRPEGSVRVWFVLRRDGSLVEMGIEESSNSNLLDDAARKSVSRGAFPAFPEQFRPEMQHRFIVELQFKPGSN